MPDTRQRPSRLSEWIPQYVLSDFVHPTEDGSFRTILESKRREEVLGSGGRLFHKMVEIKALSNITSKQIQDFLWEDIICRYEISKILITDNGKQFDARSFRDFCERLSIEQRFRFRIAPVNKWAGWRNQSDNPERLKKLSGGGSRELDRRTNQCVMVYRTTPRKDTRELPFCLCFGIEALVQVEIGSLSHWNMEFNAVKNDRLLWEDLLFRDSTRSAVPTRQNIQESFS